MGDNSSGQLGINEPCIENKSSPVLVDSLLNYHPVRVACGSFHTVALTKLGDCFAWGQNSHGQCGTKGGTAIPVHWSPQLANFE